MTEFDNGEKPSDIVFSPDYWADAEPGSKELDLDFKREKTKRIKYQDLALKTSAFLQGEDGIVIPDGSVFWPNNPDVDGWYQQPGTVAVFDWEGFVLFTPAGFSSLAKRKSRLIKIADQVQADIGASTRQFMFDPGSNDPLTAALKSGSRQIHVAEEQENGIGLYQRTVWFGIIEEDEGKRVGRLLRGIPTDGEWDGQSFLNPFSTRRVPFEVGQAQERRGPFRTEGVLRSVERVKKVEVLETGVKEPVKGRKNKSFRFAPKLGHISVGLEG